MTQNTSRYTSKLPLHTRVVPEPAKATCGRFECLKFLKVHSCKKNASTFARLQSQINYLLLSGFYVHVSDDQGDQIGRIFAYLHIQWFFTLGSVSKITEAAQILGLLFPRYQLRMNIYKQSVGPNFGRLFRKLIWSPCGQWQNKTSHIFLLYVAPKISIQKSSSFFKERQKNLGFFNRRFSQFL
jgi:hypothetical protein